MTVHLQLDSTYDSLDCTKVIQHAVSVAVCSSFKHQPTRQLLLHATRRHIVACAAYVLVITLASC